MTNPLDLRGPEFLVLYLVLMSIAVVAGVVARRVLRGPGDDPPDLADTDAYQIAVLRGGPRHAAETAIAALIHRGVICADTGSGRLHIVSAGEPSAGHPVEAAVLDAFRGASTVRAKDAVARAAVAAGPLRRELELLGLVPGGGQGASIRIGGASPLLLVGGLGLAKVFVGVSRHRPVGFLVIFLVATAVAAFVFAILPIYRTRSGDKLLARLKWDNVALRSAVARPSSMISPADVALGLAIFGFDPVLSGDIANLKRMLHPPTNSGSGGDGVSTSSCGGSGCGGGGGGCGGGGCGGCSS